MRKNKLLLLLALLMTAATGAWATDYTTLAVGDVIKVGDTFTPTDDGAINNNGVNSGETYTLIRADIDNEYNVTENTDGAYYVFKYVSMMSSPYIHFDKAFEVKAISDGLEVTKIETVKGYLFYTLTLHESAAAPAGFTVSLKDGVKDADKWTISPNPAPEGSPVTIQYTGRLKVKGVKATSDAAPAGKTVDLSTLTAGYEAKDGDVLTGTLGANVKISIADGATVTLDGVNISNGQITCSGNANIILMGDNTVSAAANNAAIKIGGSGTTLTITGSGSLTAQGGLEAAGIGTDRNENGKLSFGNIVINGGTVTATGGKEGAGIGTGLAQGEFYTTSITCGDITINGGTVTAIGGLYGAGIGTGPTMSDGGSASITCGDITINGGTVTATGGDYGPGIGTGVFLKYGSESASNRCGNITIGAGVISVTATKGSGSPNSIGKGYAYGGTQNYGTITIGGNVGAITTSPYTYDPAAPAAKPAATVTTAPTGAAIVGVGKTTELVSGGVAEGGKLMYAVTTTNTKPTSTAGFSDAVPTAKDITASGKVYVWYYVKADDTHSDSEIAATAIEVPVADIVWDGTNVSDLMRYGTDPYEKEGVTLRGNVDNVRALWDGNGNPETDGIAFETYASGGFTFTAPAGKAFTKIEMKPTGPEGWYSAKLGDGWELVEDFVGDDDNEIYTYTVTWTGSAASTVGLLTDDNYFNNGKKISYIAFYLVDAE